MATTDSSSKLDSEVVLGDPKYDGRIILYILRGRWCEPSTIFLHQSS